MDSETERALKNLLVLTEMTHNDKLMTNGDCFYIYTPTSLRGFVRYWSGEDRLHNIERIRQTIHSAFACVQTSIPTISRVSTSPKSKVSRVQDGIAVLKHLRIVKALAASRIGLRNMLQTYHNDATIKTQLQIIIDEVEDFLTVLDYAPDLRLESTTRVQNSEIVIPHDSLSTRHIGAMGE